VIDERAGEIVWSFSVDSFSIIINIPYVDRHIKDAFHVCIYDLSKEKKDQLLRDSMFYSCGSLEDIKALSLLRLREIRATSSEEDIPDFNDFYDIEEGQEQKKLIEGKRKEEQEFEERLYRENFYGNME
jgi:hypothetical protein